MFKKMFKKIAAVATVATLAIGSISVANADAFNCWFVSPVLVVAGEAADAEVDAEVTCKVNGKDVAIDKTVNDGTLYWAEDTGEYSKSDAIRLQGSWNNWGAKFIQEDTWGDNVPDAGAGIQSIEYTVKLNSLGDIDATEAQLFIAFGGDLAEKNDWGNSWQSPNHKDNKGVYDAKNASTTIKVGETKTVTLTFGEAAAPAESSSSTTGTDSAAPTGDNTMVAVLAVVALIALAGVVVTSKKRA